MRASSAVAATGVGLGVLEDLANRQDFTDSGLMSYRIAELIWDTPRWRWVAHMQTRLYDFESFLVVTALRAVAATVLLATALFSPRARVEAAACAVLLAGAAYGLERSPYGADGADQMSVIIFAGLTAAWAFPARSEGRLAALLFIAGQLTLSYVVAGVAKSVSRSWWNGTGLASVLATRNYGSMGLAKLSREHRWMAIATSVGVILFETTFVAAWFLPRPYVAAYLAAGIGFHLGVAFTMGLNTFVCPFLAAYPIAWYCMTSRL
ncbi:MAG: hypothetical protein M3326_12795 [Actinomycetota bacterium]|nr:hypothetical protein [Actinomycetota bacterium]